ncbi:MAG TPA: MFS transporter [Acidimicrobiales bacterium]|nr:MFS transporter [Acidimicrobiales bacterium]
MTASDPGPEEPAAHPGGGLLVRARSLAPDLSPLRTSPDFRRLFFGNGVSFMGSQLTAVAVPFQVYRITGSSLAVGLLALCHLVPQLTLSLVGGSLADSMDRRSLVRRCELGMLAVSLLLAANAMVGTPRLWVLYVLAFVGAGFDALGRPALWAMIPRLVPPEQFVAASSLNALYFNLGAAAGPAAAGFLIAGAGLSATYIVDALTFAAALVALSRMAPLPPADDAPAPGWSSIVEGLRYARARPVLMGTYLIDYNAMVFGMPRALFPALASSLGGGARTLGFLYGAPYAGALLVTMTGGWMRQLRRQGAGIAVSVLVWGLAILAFGLTRSLVAALFFLAVAGGADMVSGVFRMAIWNRIIPDHIRGRLAGIELANVTSGPALGDVEAGTVAALTSVRFSVVSGGVACMVGVAVLSVFLPSLLSYDSEHPTAS